ncbi:MCP four helix bundle domain-containing protein [Mesonia aquimarina]|uniref:MCP four helix bundle domain-containing protein n=1 Tax=Mesonia aquimarina TaxID=1504967 RepID=UPI000EF58124|nr:MCP four helix bundle domain-containing protein [Mesonia aquimarina]
MSFFNKIKWVLGILLVFVLIVMTNLIDRNNFVRVKDSVETIYKDRLIVKDYIFDFSKSIQQKEIALILNDSSFFTQKNTAVNNHINGIINRYEQTKLTAKETRVFRNFKNNFQDLVNSESSLLKTGFANKDKSISYISNIKQNLNELSEIQLKEGSRQMSISKKAVDTVELFTQIEIYLMIFLALGIQIIVMYNPKEKSSQK